ncbi:MAG: TIGR04282 family arsenosugar biosynthesis glycosyltransferase [Thermoleophilaceae bacterium]
MSLSVLVMAKAPRPGAVKTRLEPLLGPEGCAALQAALIGVTARWAVGAAPGGAYLAYGPDGAEHDELEPYVPPGIELFRDGEGDLGDRLVFATDFVFAQRPGPLLVVGTDMPFLSSEHALAAARALGEAQVCFGPALDGGYWIVGLREPCPEVFSLGESWGGADVLERSIDLARGAGLPTALLGAERDLDDAADARALLADPRLPPRIAEILSGA